MCNGSKNGQIRERITVGKSVYQVILLCGGLNRRTKRSEKHTWEMYKAFKTWTYRSHIGRSLILLVYLQCDSLRL